MAKARADLDLGAHLDRAAQRDYQNNGLTPAPKTEGPRKAFLRTRMAPAVSHERGMDSRHATKSPMARRAVAGRRK